MKHTMRAASWEKLVQEVGEMEGITPSSLLVTYTGRGTNKACYRIAEAYLEASAKLDGSDRYSETAKVTAKIEQRDLAIAAEAASRYLLKGN